ncbi:penicillin acylase family protein [Thermomicrobiaceae bacterium CFH 74404]|uniref:Penicillin acylase family protein n=1 Tax=Thermalbibacter longus TaxID=2951981 RepID=A0AA41W977_9BACT|nr:penicillin acylase family protein [Thermalbibacter longus]MCM8747754.1 penicillin acylase family protein [Thermalbibacter longus]
MSRFLVRLLARLLLGCRLPITQGRLAVPGLQQPVLIRRDRWGIPHIAAQTDADAWYALGFCQGQDRAFQLELLRRVVRGTLAELLGPPALPIDRLSRRIGFRHTSERQLSAVAPELRALAGAFVQGINAGMRYGLKRRPHELVLLRSRPGTWDLADVLGMVKIMSFSLASNWTSELVRLKVLTEDGPEALRALDPSYPEWHPVTDPPGVEAGPLLDRLAEELERFAALVPAGGSNNWVIAGWRTASGRPILANDPHLDPTLPPYWYLAHLQTPDWAVAGAALIGTPAIAAGHNGFAAWGVTAGLSDNTDLFLEEIGPDGRSIREGERFVPCALRHERIEVRGSRAVEDVVLETPRGPIISPILSGIPWALSLRAVWLDPLPIGGLLRLHRVRSFAEFRQALAEWPQIPLNVVYADVSGTIGWQLAGQVPRRRRGSGLIPQPGWLPGAGWEPDLLPADALPWSENPAAGFIATANNRPRREGDGPFLGADYLDGYRAARIAEALASRSDWDIRSTQALQLDVLSIPWRELRDIVLSIETPNPAANRALALLRDWDGRVTAGSPAASVFEIFLAEMCRRVAAAKAPRSANWVLGLVFGGLTDGSSWSIRRTGHLVRLLRTQPPGWFDRPWAEVIAEALAAAVRYLENRYGPRPAAWAWGRVRPLTLLHPLADPLRAPRVLQMLFNLGSFPWGGDANTVSAAGTTPLDPTGPVTFMASLRLVVDVGNWDETGVVLPGGQSGNPLSPHYADQLRLWRRGEGLRLAWTPEAVARETVATLELVPEGTQQAHRPH